MKPISEPAEAIRLSSYLSARQWIKPAPRSSSTDLHYLSPRLEEDDATLLHLLWDGDGKITHFSDEIIDAFFSEVLSQKPNALLLTGDLTFNGEKLSHEDLAQKLELLAITMSIAPLRALFTAMKCWKPHG